VGTCPFSGMGKGMEDMKIEEHDFAKKTWKRRVSVGNSCFVALLHSFEKSARVRKLRERNFGKDTKEITF
jgi:hypothetical protein